MLHPGPGAAADLLNDYSGDVLYTSDEDTIDIKHNVFDRFFKIKYAG